jgi:hypothetical protein
MKCHIVTKHHSMRTCIHSFFLSWRWIHPSLVRRWCSRGQFHQHSTGSFSASRFMPILRAHSASIPRKSWAYFLIMCISKVGHNFVGETKLRQRMPTGTFVLWAIMLVKLTPGVVVVVVERVSDASNQVEGVGGGVKVRVEDAGYSIIQTI